MEELIKPLKEKESLLVNDFDLIKESGYALITNGQDWEHKPPLYNNVWALRNYMINRGNYVLQEVTNTVGTTAIRMKNYTTWGRWRVI